MSCMQGSCATYLDGLQVLLGFGIADSTIFLDNDSPAAGAITRTGLPAVLLGEEGLGVGQQQLVSV